MASETFCLLFRGFELGPVLRLRGGWMYGEEASIYESARVDLYAATIGFSVTWW